MKKIISILILLTIIIQVFTACKSDSSDTVITVADKPANFYTKNMVPLIEEFNFNFENNTTNVMFYLSEKLYMLGSIIYTGDVWSRDSILYTYDFTTNTADYEILQPNIEAAFINYLIYDSKMNRITIETLQNDEIYSVTVNKITPESNEVFSTDIKDYKIDGNVQKIRIDSADILYIADENCLTAISADGKLLYSVQFENLQYADFNILSDDNIYVKMLNTTKNKYEYKYLNKMSNTFNGNIKLPSDIGLYSENDILSGFGNEYPLYYKDDNLLYMYDEANNQIIPLLNWSQNALSPKSMRGLTIVSPEVIVYASHNTLTNKNTIEILTLNPNNTQLETQIITLCSVGYIENVFEQKIIDFNNNNSEYQIELINYYDRNDRLGSVEKLNRAIASGDIPDIIIFNDSLQVKNYYDKGLFIDLNPYIDNDETISRDNIFEFLLEPYEYDGKLYRVSTGFSISTELGKTSNIGEKQSWSYKEMVDLANSLPPESSIHMNFCRDDLLAIFTYYEFNKLIDDKTSTCNFANTLFIDMITAMKNATTESPYSKASPEQVDKWYENYNYSYQSDEFLVLQGSISTMYDLQKYMVIFNNEPITIKGSPSIDGEMHHTNQYTRSFGITAQSKVKSGAWEFISYLLSDEMQSLKSDHMYLPATISGFDSVYNYYVNDLFWYVDGAGDLMVSEHKLDDSTYTEVEVTDAYYDTMMKLFYNSSPVVSYHSPAASIIWEEVSGFFNDMSTAEAAAGNIQNRVSIYLNEIS